MKYADCTVRDALLWEQHLKDCPPWLEPFVEVPDNAAPPLAMTPVHLEAVGSYGQAAIGWVDEQLGVTLRWWQQLAVVRQLEHREDGSLCWPMVVESASRRVGKSVRLRGMALWRMAHAELFDEAQLAIHTGKDLAIVREIQRGAWRWAESRSWRVVRAIGRESIENGDHRWLARSTDGVYGYDVTLGMVDEAWAVAPEVVAEGLEPAVLERISPQIALTSTAHRRATSLMPARIRDALVVDEDLLLLWSAPDGCELGDERTWRRSSAHWSPDRAKLLAAKHAKAAAGQQDPEFDDPDPLAGFASQYVNRWQLRDLSRSGAVFGEQLWKSRDVGVRPPGAGVFSIEVNRSRPKAWIGAAQHLGDSVHVSIVESLDGPGSLARVAELSRKYRAPVLYDGELGESLHDDLLALGLRKLVPVTPAQRVAVCTTLDDLVTQGRLSHNGDPELAAAVAAARWSDHGEGGRVFLRKNAAGEIGPLYAVGLAAFGLMTMPPRRPLIAT